MPTTLIDDKVWWNRGRKLEGICKEIAASQRDRSNVLLLAHFEGTLAAHEGALRAKGIEFQRFTQFDSSVLCGNAGDSGKCWSGLARSLGLPQSAAAGDWGATSLKTKTPTNDAPALNIIVAEHYPLRSKDEQLIEVAAGIPCNAQLAIHISLDDALLTHFGVGLVQDLFRRLGMDEATPLSHHLITNAIRQAQEKIETEVPRDLTAWSIEDWFAHNLAQPR
jgi:hypothetical protein